MVENLENGAPGKEREKIGAADLGITLSRDVRSNLPYVVIVIYLSLSSAIAAARAPRATAIEQQPRPARTLHG